MVWDDLGRDAKTANERDRDKWIGVYIGILAVILAVCTMLGGNAAKDATQRNIEASNTWAFFQAKNMRRHVIRVQIDQLELQLVGNPAMPDDAKSAIRAKIADYRRQEEVLGKDPDKPAEAREGLDQLFEKAKRLEAERDVALRKDPYFDYAQALLQIAIVLASIAIISGGSGLLGVSFLLALLGTLLTINGTTLLVAVPGSVRSRGRAAGVEKNARQERPGPRRTPRGNRAGRAFQAPLRAIGPHAVPSRRRSCCTGEEMTTPIIDSETLLRNVIPLARRKMAEAGSLAPFGATVDGDGAFTLLSSPDAAGSDDVATSVGSVKSAIREAVAQQACRAAALVYETKVNMPPDDEEVADAVVVSLGHRDGYAVDLFYPFRKEEGSVVWGEAFARESMADLLAAA